MAEPQFPDHVQLADWLLRIERLHPKSWDLGLDRIGTVAERLGVLGQLGRVVIVGGTNGKGTVVHLVESLLMGAGLHVGSTLSPHLVRFEERFRLDGVEAQPAQLIEAFELIDQARAEISLTYFEFAFLAALVLFRDAQVDVSVLEVGLGGRLDAANICDADVAVITSVALDHQEWLGDTVELIGAEKAAISRAGRPLVCGDAEPPASVRAVERDGVLLRLPGRDFEWDANHAWRLADGSRAVHAQPPPQVPPANAAVALQVLHELDVPLSDADVRRLFAGFGVTARCQFVERHVPLLVDVAHNPHAATWLAKQIARRAPAGRIHLVVGTLRDKDAEGLVAMLAPLSHAVHLASTAGARGLAAIDLDARLEAAHINTPPRLLHRDVAAALEALERDATGQDLIVVCGCFAAAAAALEWASAAR